MLVTFKGAMTTEVSTLLVPQCHADRSHRSWQARQLVAGGMSWRPQAGVITCVRSRIVGHLGVCSDAGVLADGTKLSEQPQTIAE